MMSESINLDLFDEIDEFKALRHEYLSRLRAH